MNEYTNPDPEGIDNIRVVGAGLMRLAEEQIGIRQVVEDRWLRDLEQYIGEYDQQTKTRLEKSGGSRAFVNGTRSKTAAAEARLSDMLFPTDDKNWGIMPTPVPDMMTDSQLPMVDEMGRPLLKENGEPFTEQDAIEEEMEIANDKATAMEREIHDQLTEAHYQDICRSVIHDACTLGSGIIKAPIILNRSRRKWQQIDGSVYELTIENEYTPGVEHVKVWDFFPDMSVTDIKDARFTFERRYVSKKQLIDLSNRPGYLFDEIAAVIKEEPESRTASGSSYIAKIRELSDLSVDINKGKYELWEYHGPLSKEDLTLCGCEVDDDLEEPEAVIVFIGSHVIKADLNPMETSDNPYSMFVYERDDSSIFGMGVPYLVRNEQRIMNAAWRMVIDNAGLSTGPQIIINKEVITPSDGTWDLKPKKIWYVNDPDIRVSDAFSSFAIASHQTELSNIYHMARQMMDDVTNLPLLAQGEQGNAPDTATGMSMLMNSSNVVLRRVVKGFDDDITTPVITRFYDWNMQNSQKEDIKGDYNVSARGSSTLLVKETQTQALMGLMRASESNVFGPLTKHAALYRKAVQAQHLVADEIIKTDDELDLESENEQENIPPIEIILEQMKAELTLQVEQLRSQTDIQVAAIRSADNQEKTQAEAVKTQLQEDNKANMFMAEQQIKEKFGTGI